MTTTETPRIEDEFVYSGRRMSGTKAMYEYRRVLDVDRAFYYAKPLKRGVAVGGTFGVTRLEGETIRVVAVHESRMPWANVETIAEWSAADKATSVMLAKITNDRKVARETPDPIADALAVLGKAYAAQHSIAARAAFTDYVVAAMHGAR